MFFTVPKKSMFSRLLEVLSSDRPINFQDRLVVTASHTPRRRVKLACKRQVRVSSTESKYSYHNANLCYYSSVKFLLDIVLDVPVFAILQIRLTYYLSKLHIIQYSLYMIPQKCGVVNIKLGNFRKNPKKVLTFLNLGDII